MLTAIIPVHNRADLLECLLDSIDRQTVPFAEVVVVDNASTDGAAALARARGCRVIEMGHARPAQNPPAARVFPDPIADR